MAEIQTRGPILTVKCLLDTTDIVVTLDDHLRTIAQTVDELARQTNNDTDITVEMKTSSQCVIPLLLSYTKITEHTIETDTRWLSSIPASIFTDVFAVAVTLQMFSACDLMHNRAIDMHSSGDSLLPPLHPTELAAFLERLKNTYYNGPERVCVQYYDEPVATEKMTGNWEFAN